MRMFLAGSLAGQVPADRSPQSLRRHRDRLRPPRDAADVERAVADAVERRRTACGSFRASSATRILGRTAALIEAQRAKSSPGSSAAKRERPWPKGGAKFRGPAKRSLFRPKRPSGSRARCCRWTAPRRSGKAGLHAARPLRRRGRDHSLQLSAEPGRAQGRSRPGRRQRGRAQAGQRHAPFGAGAGRNPARSRPAAAGHFLPDRLGRGDRRCALRAMPRVRKISFTGSRESASTSCQRAGLKRVTMELGLEQPADRARRRRSGPGGRGNRGHRLLERRTGLHLGAAGDRPERRLWQPARRAASRGSRRSASATSSTRKRKWAR